MDKLTYLNALSDALDGLMSQGERDEIIRYYSEYFADAGEGREGEVIAELGSPEALARRLAADEEAFEKKDRASRKGGMVAKLLVLFIVICLVLGSLKTATNLLGRSGHEEDKLPSQTEIDRLNEKAGNGFWNMADGYMSSFDSIDADIDFGDLTVSGGEDFSIYVSITGDLGDYRIDWSVASDGQLKITSSGKSGHFGSNTSATVVVTAPYGTELRDVELETSLGNVSITELTVSGDISAHTSLGDVECVESYVPGETKLSTNLGDVNYALSDMVEGQKIDLETDMGDIEVNMDFPEAQCAYDLSTAMGDIQINDRKEGDEAVKHASSGCHLEAETSMGDISVFFKEKQ